MSSLQSDLQSKRWVGTCAMSMSLLTPLRREPAGWRQFSLWSRSMAGEYGHRWGGHSHANLSRVIANGNEASRPFCFILSSFSPIFPDNIETETQECSNPTTAALISALNLLRFIDYRQLHRKWVEKGSHMRIGKHTCPAPTASWAGFSHLEPDEWFKLGKATRVTDLSMLRIRWLVDDMEHANAYA